MTDQTPLWQYRETIKRRAFGCHGIMVKYEYTNHRGRVQCSTPGLAFPCTTFGVLEGAFDWFGPLVLWWQDKGKQVAIARRPRLSNDDSCITIDRPVCFVAIDDQEWARCLMESLARGEGFVDHPRSGKSLFCLVVDKAEQEVEVNPIQSSYALFLDTSRQVPQEGLDRFSGVLGKLGKIESHFSEATQKYLKRADLMGFVPQAQAKLESCVHRPKF